MIDKNKIYKYVNITFKIVLTISIILSISKSCAKAITYEDISYYVNMTASYYPNNQYYQHIKNCVNQNNFKNNMPNGIENYNFISIYSTLSENIYLRFYNASSYNISATSMRYTGNQAECRYNGNNNTWSVTNLSNTNQTNYPMEARCYSNTPNDYNNLKGMNYNTTDFSEYTMPETFVGIQAIPQHTYLQYETDINNWAYNPQYDFGSGDIFTWYYKGNMYNNTRIQLGHIIPYDSYYYEIYLKEQKTNIIIGESYVSENPYNPWNNGALYIDNQHNVLVNTINLDYSKQYRLEIDSYYGDGGLDLWSQEEWYIFLPSNANISGDIILGFGSGDFTTQDSTMQIIENNNNFLTELTDNLFKVESGDMQRIINNIKQKYNYSGDEEIEKQILEIAQQTNGDFRISWNEYTPNFSIKGQQMRFDGPMIPSGDINFSKIERENPSLQETMKWTRIILSFAIITLIAREYTKLLLDAVGGSVLLADHDKDSNRIIDGGDKK